ncbi:MAG: hypothetical protein V5B38_19385 [Candidatus Accumulibacter propinquus]|jgi:hypothetical protein
MSSHEKCDHEIGSIRHRFLSGSWAVGGNGCRSKCLGLLLALLLGLTEHSYASRDASTTLSLDCRYASVAGAQCSTRLSGPVLNIDLTLIGANGKQEKLERMKSDRVEDAQWKSGFRCTSIGTRIRKQRDLIRISGHHDCQVAVRMCIDIQSLIAPTAFRSLAGVIEFKDWALSIQGDARLGASVQPQRRAVRLCSDPRGQPTADWAIDLRSGSMDEIRDVLQNVQAPLVDATGRIIGYSKNSPVIKEGYFFVDLTESNTTKLLPLIRQSGFPYTLVYASTWAKSYGSYEFNNKAYPSGLAGLKRVVSEANAAGIKVGLHTLTGFVSKNDPYVRRGVPDNRLLQDEQSTLLNSIDARSKTIEATDSLATFPTLPAFYGSGKAGLDLRIDNEIISCPRIIVADRGRFMDCRRGLHGTVAVGHAAGAPIGHLAERYGSYLADLSSTLKEEIGVRLADVINQAGLDLVYFDGGELGSASGDLDWYVAEQQIEVLKRVRRPVVVEGSGAVPRLWPYLTRLVADDFAALAPVDYLDAHKIGRVYKSYVKNLIPANLGWLGLLKETPSYPATTPEDISTYVARSLAFDVPTSIETHYDDLLNNPYTGRLLDILRAGNRTILAGVLPSKSREVSSEGLWYYMDTQGPALWRLRLSRMTAGNTESEAEAISTRNEDKHIFMRIRNIRTTSLKEDGSIPLVDHQRPVKRVSELPVTEGNRGELVESVSLATGTSLVESSGFVDFVDRSPKSTALDLRLARQMVVDLNYAPGSESTVEKSGSSCAVLNLQLEDNRGQYRDYLLQLRSSGQQRVLLDYETSAPIMLRRYLPARNSYAYKAAIYGFNFAAVTKLNIRRMSSCGHGGAVRLNRVAMLKERAGNLQNVRLRVGNKVYPVVSEIGTGSTLDVYPDGKLSVCNGAVCEPKTIDWPSGGMLSGNKLSVEYVGNASAEITVGILGNSVAIPVAMGKMQ